nr:unnamed protein product [Callosobruchus chinensis]
MLPEKTVILKEGNLLYSKLQCVFCGKCLSFRPVSGNGGNYSCGRCCPASKQCQLYEAVAEHLEFTCIFEGCESLLNWAGVEAHERICNFREISCPFSECADRFQLNCYQSHFEDSHILHKEAYNSNDYDIENLSSSMAYVNLHCIFYEGLTFLVFIRICKLNAGNRAMCQYSVFYMTSEQDRSSLELELRINITPDLFLTKIVNCNNIMQYIDTQHCLSCLYKSCDKPAHNNIGNALLIDVFEFLTEKQPVSYAIKVHGKMDNDLSDLECPICFNHFGEEIYLCPSGHSLCENCWLELTYCPLCRVNIQNPVRNYTLEKFIKSNKL